MSGQMRKYNYENYHKQLKAMQEPVMAGELPKVKLNLRGIREYAKKKGVAIASLTDEEKQLFISE
ncbi:MAG: hypothetical protein NC400_06040 [Clostridium sp.]|nr:hypothetical protein [Clostridium sp.]